MIAALLVQFANPRGDGTLSRILLESESGEGGGFTSVGAVKLKA